MTQDTFNEITQLIELNNIRVRKGYCTSAGLFRVFQGHRPTSGGQRVLLRDAREILIQRGTTNSVEEHGERIELTLDDRSVSGVHARIERDGTRFLLHDLGSRNGTYVNGVRRECTVLGNGDLIEVGRTFFRFRRDIQADWDAATNYERRGDAKRTVGTLLPWLQEEFGALQRIARSETSILVTGPSGAGKEVLAGFIHEHSGRRGELVAVNCAAIPEQLVESELFGCTRGAYTGGVDRPGLVTVSSGGTLLLDEVGDLPLSAQAVLLRVLEEGRVRPVGAVRSVPVDLRVVAATHRDLHRMVVQGEFRQDLLARLEGYSVSAPSLNERREDLGYLVASLIAQLDGVNAQAMQFERCAARALVQYDWPLNIRELRRCLRVTALLSAGQPVTLAHLPRELRSAMEEARCVEPAQMSPEDAKKRAALVTALRENGGNVSATARSLDRVRTQIQRWIRRYNIQAEEYLTPMRA